MYVTVYDRLFKNFCDKSISLLEIGVQNGGSLELWSKYFKSGKKFIGCDCNEKLFNLSFKDPRIDIVVGDINTLVIKNKIHKYSN